MVKIMQALLASQVMVMSAISLPFTPTQSRQRNFISWYRKKNRRFQKVRNRPNTTHPPRVGGMV